MLDDTLIVVTSGNGGDTALDPETNTPLRGGKFTLWEGGARVPVVIQGRMVRFGGRSHRDLFHAVDWVPTLLHAAGIHPSKFRPSLDGISHWNAFLGSTKQAYSREEILYNIDNKSAAIRVGDYKLILGNPVEKSYQFSMSELDINPSCARYRTSILASKQENCYSKFESEMLFDVAEDPSEETSILKYLGRIGLLLEKKLDGYMQEVVPPQSEKSHENTVDLKDGTLYPGWC
ncbi:arylsulfatase B-like [Lineus longissimus]|uniref:arylsulfatase B-like n=1 Tax=Lineus longissimus TaxID=88925 RepID=UPI00315D3D4A